MAKHRHHMAHRYIELFRSSADELMRALGLTGSAHSSAQFSPTPSKERQHQQHTDYRPNIRSSQYFQSKQPQSIKSTCILMRGLPYSCTESDITKFFQEIDVTPIRIHRKADGAEAYVEFYSISDTDTAMSRHRSYIGRRYIELFRVTYEDMARTVGLPITSTNIPASALSLNSSLMGVHPLYALSAQRRPNPSAQPHPALNDSYHPQQQQFRSNPHRSHYQQHQQQPPQHGADKHSYGPSPPQQVLLSAANMNMNAAALLSQSNGLGLPPLQNGSQQQQQKAQQQQQQSQNPPQYYQAPYF